MLLYEIDVAAQSGLVGLPQVGPPGTLLVGTSVLKTTLLQIYVAKISCKDPAASLLVEDHILHHGDHGFSMTRIRWCRWSSRIGKGRSLEFFSCREWT